MKERHPLWVWIDPTRRCNLKCRLCYTKDGQGAEDLSLPILRSIVDRLMSEPRIEIRQITFNWRGEPTLNKALPALLGELRQRRAGFPIEFHTNATAINERSAHRIIDACGEGLTVCVSIDGGTQASHDAQRGRGTFHRAIRGARALLKARGERAWPRIVLHQLDLRVSHDAYDDEFMSLSRDVDLWQRKVPIVPGGERRLFGSEPLSAAGTSLVDQWQAVAMPWDIPTGACFWAGNSLSIAPNGDVYICLLSSTPSGVLGNLLVDPVWTLVDKSRQWRERLEVDGRRDTAHCATCRMENGSVSTQWANGNAVAT